MSTPAALSQLQRTIILLYGMQESDISALEDEILEGSKRAWRTALEEKARAYGCAKSARPPSRGYLSELKARAKADAESIAQTWNRELKNQVIRLYNDNPRANRYYYIDNLEAWASQRNIWKSRQISVQTEQNARALAQNAFRAENGLRGTMYRYTGPPPVSEICQRRFAMGLVDEETVGKNPTPAHLGPCIHEWQEVATERIPCEEMWLG